MEHMTLLSPIDELAVKWIIEKTLELDKDFKEYHLWHTQSN